MENTLTSINLELTTACPLHCSQCYCDLNNSKHLNLNLAKKWIDEASLNGIKNIALSGGETLCYPHIFDVITYAKEKKMTVSAAFSGWGLTQSIIYKLSKAGLDNICVSLNGSTENINSMSRDGYDFSINAIRLLKENNYSMTTIINWVMHSNNVEDFPNIINIAEEHNIDVIDIISFKPDSKAMMRSAPSRAQMEYIAEIVKSQNYNVKIAVESCYSPLLALVRETKLFGNFNIGINRGCRAGKQVISVNVDGTLSPCRHISYKENYDSIREYISKSEVIHNIISCSESNAISPCSSCKFIKNCIPCMAISTEIYKNIFRGNPLCPLGV